MTIYRNGWDVYSSGSNQNLVNFPWVTGKVRGGDHWVVFDYIAKRWNAEVKTIRKDWSWGYTNRSVRGASVISEHATGTAVDFNAPLHPLGKKNTFSAADQAKIRQIMKDVSHAARWGGRWSRPDDMHVELRQASLTFG
ncbi:M15 family metallopeptidase [Glutamicibacter sp. NPDC087344]|uniref:M15 family metallopeptidase n=1 Tax=Glutamicibacter sp. NPDC087344 TaxID=3363994 RepID=UPI0038236B94